MKQLLLIRHGISVANEAKKYCGWTDSPLSEAGVEDLQHRRAQCCYPSLQGFSIYTSGLCRTELTLETLYGQMPHQIAPDFREMHFGIFENRTYLEMKDDPAYQTWLSGDNEKNVCPGGESGVQMTQRVCDALAQLMEREEKVCIVCHGGVIAAIMAHLFPEEPKDRYTWQPDNGCGYLVMFSETPRYIPAPFPKAHWAEKHYSFCQNRACEFFPCHPEVPEAEFNCLFCYCPLYALGDQCGGNFTFTANGTKDCTACTLPHRKNSYGYVIHRFDALVQMMRQNHLTPTIGDGKSSCPLENPEQS